MDSPSDPDAGARGLRALAAARSLETDGQYNAAKLFRAAAVAEAIRATRDFPAPGPARDELLADAIADRRSWAGADALVASMERTRAAIGAGQPWVTLEEAPHAFVCRACGEVLLGEPPPACPACGARRLTFIEVLPIHFLEPLAVEPLLGLLAETPVEVERLCARAADARTGRSGWPPHEIVLHFITAERVLGGRAERMLAEDEPLLGSVAPPVGEAGGEPTALAQLVANFREGRERTLTRLRGLRADQWERGGFHPEWGRITVRQQFAYVVRHEQSHLGELAAACAGT